jgi:hypothetical protein
LRPEDHIPNDIHTPFHYNLHQITSMSDRHPTSFSLALARLLSILIILATVAIGRQLLTEAAQLKRQEAAFVGPGLPEFRSFFVRLDGYGVLVFVIPMLWATIGMWRRSRYDAVLLAMLCLLCSVPAIIFAMAGSSSQSPRKPPVISSGILIGYVALAWACAIAAIKTSIDMRLAPVYSGHAFTVVAPPPLPTSRPDFNVVDDLPKDRD